MKTIVVIGIIVIAIIILILIIRSSNFSTRLKIAREEKDKLLERVKEGNILVKSLCEQLRASLQSNLNGAELEITLENAICFRDIFPILYFQQMVYVPILKDNGNSGFVLVGAVEHSSSRWKNGKTGYSDNNPKGSIIPLERLEEINKAIGDNAMISYTATRI